MKQHVSKREQQIAAAVDDENEGRRQDVPEPPRIARAQARARIGTRWGPPGDPLGRHDGLVAHAGAVACAMPRRRRRRRRRRRKRRSRRWGWGGGGGEAIQAVTIASWNLPF